MEQIKNVTLFLTLVLDSVAVFALLLKPLREKIFGLSLIKEGLKSILRFEMLYIYYNGHDNKNHLRPHEFENFMLMYKAYKAMDGNSFIDKIYKEVEKMEVVA